MRVAKAKVHLRGKQPKLTANQAKQLVELSDLGTYSTAELDELFGCRPLHDLANAAARPPSSS